MIYRLIQSSFKKNKILIENFSYLSALQIFNMFAPLITLPYLIRILGADKYGVVIFAQTLAFYFSIVINFGFNISAVKDISVNKENKVRLSEIVSSIVQIKFILWGISFLIFFAAVMLIPKLNQDKLLYLFSFGICFNELLFSRWFFQGIEKMKYVTYINLTARLLFLILVFVVIKNKEDYYLVPLLYMIGGIIGGGLAMYIMFIKEQIDFKFQNKSILKIHFIKSLPFFGAKISTMLRDSSTIVIIGIFFTNSAVAYYDVAMKIVAVFTTLFQNIPVVILPKLIVTKNHVFARKIFKWSLISAAIFYLIILVFSKQLVLIVGGSNVLDAVILLKILGSFSILYVANTLLNYFLIANDKQKLVYKSITISFLFYIFMAFGLIIEKSIVLLIVIFIMASILDFSYKFYFLRKANLTHWLYETEK